MHRIRVLRRGRVVRELVFEGEISVGRTIHNVVRLPEQSVSSNHAKLYLEEGESEGCYLVDLDSRNGTVLDGERVPAGKPQRLTGGERIGVGSFELTYVPPQHSTIFPDGLDDAEFDDMNVLPPPSVQRKKRIEWGDMLAVAALVLSISALALLVLRRVM